MVNVYTLSLPDERSEGGDVAVTNRAEDCRT
jgi:hypothetical protein